jgi:hypothetical protein
VSTTSHTETVGNVQVTTTTTRSEHRESFDGLKVPGRPPKGKPGAPGHSGWLLRNPHAAAFLPLEVMP